MFGACVPASNRGVCSRLREVGRNAVKFCDNDSYQNVRPRIGGGVNLSPRQGQYQGMPVSFVSVVLEFVSAMASDSANVGLTIAEATTIAAGSNDQRCSHPGADQCRWPSWCCSVYMPGFPGARHASGGGAFYPAVRAGFNRCCERVCVRRGCQRVAVANPRVRCVDCDQCAQPGAFRAPN